jgi:DNA-directed RNA polymerase
MKISKKYVKFTKLNITNNILGKRHNITIRKRTTDINYVKQINAIVPNIIHSFDASHIAILVREIIQTNSNLNLLIVHDCFGSHSTNIKDLKALIIKSFIEIYANINYIENFHNFNINYISNLFTIEDNSIISPNGKYPIPLKPSLGELNLKDIESNLTNMVI